ncbi:MAG: hypothetical protein ACOX6T_08975 [Myxococcales bacterium]|jgi:hypothetical protein
MRRDSCLLILLLVFTSCGAADEALQKAPHDQDPDAGLWNPADTSVPPHDAGSTANPPDAGSVRSPCELSSPLVHLEAASEPLAMGALAVADGVAGLAWSKNGLPRMTLFSTEDGSVVADNPVRDLGSLVPEALDFGAGLFLLAGSRPTGGGSAYFDLAGAQGATSLLTDLWPMAASRSVEGGLVLAYSWPPTPASDRAVLGLSLGSGASVLSSVPFGTSARREVRWDLAWSSFGESIACGSMSDANGEWLALYAQHEQAVTAIPTGEKVAAHSGAEASFGCRIAVSQSLRVVAFAETDGSPRVVWTAANGTVLAGPVPFLAGWRPAGQFDVAVRDTATALAFFDNSLGAPRVSVRLYPTPGAEPVELRAEQGLGLGSFVAQRVRVERAGDDFFVAFDAALQTGATHLVVRKVTCSF